MKSFSFPSAARWSVSLTMLAAVLTCRPAPGQVPSGAGVDGIVGSGSGHVELEPERLELTMHVQAAGADAKSAAKALISHKDRIRQALSAMNADDESIRFSAMRFDSGDSDEQRMRTQMMRQMRSAGLGGGTPPSGAPTIVTAKASLRVQWPLPSMDPDALAILPQGLKEQIISRDLAGKNIQPELDDSAKEALAEMQEMMEDSFGYGYSGGRDQGEPVIRYVAIAKPEHRERALKQAFERARRSAEGIATAAGITLGKLKSVYAQDQLNAERVQMMRYMGYDEDDASLPPVEDQVSASSLDGLRLNVSVVTVYEIDR